MSKHFTMPRLLRVTGPSIAMMLFTSIYGIVDGLFVSNFAGKTAFAAVNLIMPFIMILGCTGFMIGSGGSELVAKTRGMGDDKKANERFSLMVYFALALGIVLALIGFFTMEPVARLLGAGDNMLDLCVLYGRISMVSLPAYMLQYAFQAFFNTAGKPKLGLAVTVIAGCMNIVLDAVFVGVFGWGVMGAAWATVITEFVGGFIPIIYFARPNSSALRLGRTVLDWRAIGGACFNGSSEMMSNIAQSVVSMLYNFQLMALYGEDGVAAYGACMYICFVFLAVLMGYAVGTAPLMSYQHGAKNYEEMNSLWKKSLAFMAIFGIAMFVLAELCAGPFAYIYTGYDEGLYNLTKYAFHLFSVAYLICGFSMYGSSLFTSLGNGLVSALIAFLRVLVFEAIAIFVLPMLFGPAAIWLSWTVGELLALALTFGFMFGLGKTYGYRKAPLR